MSEIVGCDLSNVMALGAWDAQDGTVLELSEARAGDLGRPMLPEHPKSPRVRLAPQATSRPIANWRPLCSGVREDIMAAAGLRSLCDCGTRGRFAHQWLRLAHRESARGWLMRNCHTSGGGHRRSLWRGLVQGGPRLTTVGRYAARARLRTGCWPNRSAGAEEGARQQQ